MTEKPQASAPLLWGARLFEDVAFTLDSSVMSEFRVRPPRVVSADGIATDYEHEASGTL